MSLDVSLYFEAGQDSQEFCTKEIYIRENGSTRKISLAEWQERFPGTEPLIVSNCSDETEVYSANITHNLGKMADACGVYDVVWRPEENNVTHAYQLIKTLQKGISRLEQTPSFFKTLNPTNGWGSYEGLLVFLKHYLDACEKYPQALVIVSR